MGMKRNRIIEIWFVLSDMAVLSFLWVICSLPVFTIGAASSAAYYAMVRGVRQDTGKLTRLFFESFRRNFRQSTKWSLMLGLPCAVFAAVVYVTLQLDLGVYGMIYRFVSLWLIAFALILALNVFPVIGRFELSDRDVFAASVGLLRAGFVKCLILFMMLLAFQAVCALYPPVLLLAPGTYFYTASVLQEELFPKVLAFDDPLSRPPADETGDADGAVREDPKI